MVSLWIKNHVRRQWIALGAVAVAASLAGCGNAQGTADQEQMAARPSATTGDPDGAKSRLPCRELTSMTIDYFGLGRGYVTPELAVRSIAKNGQTVEITTRPGHGPTFAIKTSDGELLANGTVIKTDGRWLVEQLIACDLGDLKIGEVRRGAPSPSSGCEIPDRVAQAIELGALSEKEACRIVRRGEQAIEARLGPPDFLEGPSLVIEGSVNQRWVAQCRTGSFPVGEGYKTAELYCNAILKIAAGELEPNETCGPPECSQPGTPVWAYGEADLRALADADRN